MTNKSLSPVYDLIRADGSIVINKNLVFAIGINETIVYSEILSKYNYFANKKKLTEDGFFYNTVDNLFLDTGLGEKPQRAAIKRLKKIDLIDYKVQGVPPLRYFKVVDNVETLFKLIEIGKLKREEIELKLSEKIDTSKLRLMEGIKNSNKEELKQPNGSVNNTNLNKTNQNNTKRVLHHLSQSDDTFILEYLWIMENYGFSHKRVSEENYNKILTEISDLKGDGIELEDWNSAVEEHFENLPEGNDGDINCFLTASRRYFG